MQLLEGPAMSHEPGREVIQQLGVRRRIGARPEIVGRANDGLAEMMQPHAIDNYARGQRIVGGGDLLREFESAAAVFEWFAGTRVVTRETDELQKLARHNGSFVSWIAFDEDRRVMRLVRIHR